MQLPAFAAQPDVEVLILGAGWTSTFLIPLCVERRVSYAATSRPSHPKPETVPFHFDEHAAHPDRGAFAALPSARTVLVTFPIVAPGAATRLVRLYEETHPGAAPRFVQLGSSGIWELQPGQDSVWLDRHSPYKTHDARAAAEQELLALSPGTPTTVLNLSGLYGGPRAMKHVVGRVAPTKEALRRSGSIHMIHGIDVARVILAVHSNFALAAGQRWLLTNNRVYDWWDIAATWGTEFATLKGQAPSPHARGERGLQPQWARELMREERVRALPRSPEQLGRALDSRDFWDTFGLEPLILQLD